MVEVKRGFLSLFNFIPCHLLRAFFIAQNQRIMKDYFEDIAKYEAEFECGDCDNNGMDQFDYRNTVSNGEIWCCGNCNAEILVSEEPNEDNY